MSKKCKHQACAEVSCHGETLHADIWYPGRKDDTGDAIQHIEVGLYDVRAADSVRVHYDFDRDGWVVEQASTFSWEAGDNKCDPDWQEVSFAQAWARKKED